MKKLRRWVNSNSLQKVNKPKNIKEIIGSLAAGFRADPPYATAICGKQMNNHSAAENIREQLFCQQKTECNLCTKQ